MDKRPIGIFDSGVGGGTVPANSNRKTAASQRGQNQKGKASAGDSRG